MSESPIKVIPCTDGQCNMCTVKQPDYNASCYRILSTNPDRRIVLIICETCAESLWRQLGAMNYYE